MTTVPTVGRGPWAASATPGEKGPAQPSMLVRTATASFRRQAMFVAVGWACLRLQAGTRKAARDGGEPNFDFEFGNRRQVHVLALQLSGLGNQ